MKVRDLVRKLNRFDDELDVYVSEGGCLNDGVNAHSAFEVELEDKKVVVIQ